LLRGGGDGMAGARRPAQPAGTRVAVTMKTPEIDTWLGRTLDHLVLPRQFERDLHRSLDTSRTWSRTSSELVPE
jgi:hypothetical protein